MMNYFSDEDLTRALRESRGLSSEPDETRSLQSKREDDEQLKEEMEKLSDYPLGKFGRSLYRLMVKKWPKAEDNYDWVYAPGDLEIIPLHEASDSALSKVKLANPALAPVGAVTVITESMDTLPTPGTITIVKSAGLRPPQIPRSQRVRSDTDREGFMIDVKPFPSAQARILNLKYIRDTKFVGGARPENLIPRNAFINSEGIYRRQDVLPLNLNTMIKSALPGRPGVKVGMRVFDKFIGSKCFPRYVFIDESHRAHGDVADIKSALKSIEHALTKYQSKGLVVYAASPRSPWNAAVDFVCNIFKSKHETELSGNHQLHSKGVERVEWTLDRDPASALALRGSAGHMRDYWFKLQDHQLWFGWHNKSEHTAPQTIFKVGSSEPVAAGELMVAALESAHVEREKAMELMGSLKDFVERQTQVH